MAERNKVDFFKKTATPDRRLWDTSIQTAKSF